MVSKFWGYITLIDDAIGEFVKFLKEEGLYESLFMAITADHGDAMGAHRINCVTLVGHFLDHIVLQHQWH